MVTDREVAISLDAGEDAWRRALVRARARRYEVEFLGSHDCTAYPVSYWRINSSSEPGTFRHVSVARLQRGYGLTCDCPAGQHSKPCVHIALVLRELGALDDPGPGIELPAAA